MGLLDKIFKKKVCDICGEEIGLLGNRKLEDGNLCKACAAKLSPWFSERRESTVEEIRQQLEYREENKELVAAFHTTKTFGVGTKVLIDEEQKKFMVTSARNIGEANPDVMDISMVTGCRIDSQKNRTEITRKDEEGKSVSFNPKRYTYRFNVLVIINVTHPYFDEMKFTLTPSPVTIETGPSGREPDPMKDQDYREAIEMGEQIRAALGQAPEPEPEPAEASAEVKCPWCGAMTVPTEKGTCAFCGGELER